MIEPPRRNKDKKVPVTKWENHRCHRYYPSVKKPVSSLPCVMFVWYNVVLSVYQQLVFVPRHSEGISSFHLQK